MPRYRLLWWSLGWAACVLSLMSPALRVRWSERWAFKLPSIEPGAFWIHAASIGEGKSARNLFARIRMETDWVCLRTATSSGCFSVADGHHAISALPMDAPWAVRRWLDRVRPRVLVLVESELWPNLLLACKARGIPVVVVGARRGKGQARFFRWAPGLYRRCLGALSNIAVTYPDDAAFYGNGDCKPVLWGSKACRARPCPVTMARSWWVAGSTHEPEESLLIGAHLKVGEDFAWSLLQDDFIESPIQRRIEQTGMEWVRLLR